MIDGLHIAPLKIVLNERGRLMEVQRSDDPNCPGIAQIYVTQTLKDVVKAWYRHVRQIDQLAVVAGQVKFVFYDDRKGSRTEGEVQEIVVGELASKLVKIPPGVWHGFKAVGDRDALVLHINSEAFDFAAPDEQRLAPDDPAIPFKW